MYSPYARSEIQQLPSSLIREVANAAMGQTNVIPFWFGESDRSTASFICEEAASSLRRGETFYTQNLGRPYLLEAIADYLTKLHGRVIDVGRLGAVNSGVTGLTLASELLLSPGDRVVAITPLWPNVCVIPTIFGAQVHRESLRVEHGRWSLDLDRLTDALTPDTKALIINSPNNPTGWTIDELGVKTILEHCRKLGIWILCDDVYERLIYDPATASAPSFQKFYEEGDRIISVNSFSKAWSMTGWRAGWILAPRAMSSDLTKVIEYNSSTMFEPVQRAATAALQRGEAEIASLRAMLGNTRAILVDALKAIPGVEVPDAGGAMYVFFRLRGHSDSLATAKNLVNEVGLGLAPGLSFGPEGEGWLRWCHAVSDPARLLQGVERLSRFVSQHARS